MGKMQRAKGAAYERHISHRLQAVYPKAQRGIGQARAGGEVPDVIGTPWWTELKHRKVVNLLAALKQATTNTDGRPPLVVARRDKEKDVVCLYLDDFLELVRLAEVGYAESLHDRARGETHPEADWRKRQLALDLEKDKP